MPNYLTDLICESTESVSANADSIFARIKSALQFEIAYSFTELLEHSVNSESYIVSPDYYGCDGFIPNHQLEFSATDHLNSQFAFDAIQIGRLGDLLIFTIYSYSPLPE